MGKAFRAGIHRKWKTNDHIGPLPFRRKPEAPLALVLERILLHQTATIEYLPHRFGRGARLRRYLTYTVECLAAWKRPKIPF